MRVDAKEIMDKLKKKHVRRTFYLSESVYEEFKTACRDTSVSNVLEELMRLFIESTKNEKRGSK